MFPKVNLTDLPVASSLQWDQAFGAWLFRNGKSRNTINAYLQDLRHFAEFFQRENGQGFDPSLLNATDIKKYFAKLDIDKTVAPRTRNRRFASLRVLVNFAVEEGALEYDPTVSIKRVKVKVIPRDRTAAEIQSINQVVEEGSHLRRLDQSHALLGRRDRIIYILAKDAGLRESEIKDLDISDIDFADRRIHVLGNQRYRLRRSQDPRARQG